MQQEWKRLAEGVELGISRTDKFKTGLLSVTLTVPLRRETAAAGALIPNVLYRGSRSCPDIERLAALKQNPDYKPDSDALKKYLDENNKPTNSLKNAARVKAPGWDPDDPATHLYLKPDGTTTKNKDEAEIVKNPAYNANSPDGMKYLDAQGNPTNDPEKAAKQLNDTGPNAYDPTYVKGMKYLKLKDGVNPEDVDYSDPDYINKFFEPTDDPDKAAKVYSFSEDHLEENRYLFQLTDMVDEKGHYMRDKYGVEIKDEPVDVSDTLLYGSIQSLREILTEEGEFSEDYDVALDPNAKTKRGIPYYQKVMDNWAQTFAEVFNAANQMDPAVVYKTTENAPNDNKDPAGADGCFLDANGMHVTYKDKDGNTVPVSSLKKELDADGNPVIDPATGKEKMIPKEISDYTADELKALRDSAQLKEEYSFYDGGVLFSNSGDGNDPTGITAKNISIAYDWDKGAVRVLNTKEANTYDASKGEWSSHTTRQDNILHMINLIGEKRGFVASDTVANVNDGGKAFFNGTFEEMFTGISGTLATDRNATTKLYSDHSVTSLNLDNSRASVSGVDLNDEATSMMQFEKSYSAACRLLTTLDSMLDKLINGTAI